MGIPTEFSPQQLPRHEYLAMIKSQFILHHDPGMAQKATEGIRPPLQDVFIDAMALAWIVNDSTAEVEISLTTKLDGSRFHDALLLAGFRLVHICPLQGNTKYFTPLETILRFGLAVFFCTLLGTMARKKAYSPLLARLIREEVAEKNPKELRSEGIQPALLWLLFLGRASVLESEDDDWLDTMILEIMKALKLETAEDLAQMLSLFPWIPVLHDAASGG